MSLTVRNFAQVQGDIAAEEEQNVKSENSFDYRAIKSDNDDLMASSSHGGPWFVSDEQQMQMVGLPTQFGGSMAIEFGGGGTSKKKSKRMDFYCDICHVELNSEETKNTHLQGAKHIKKKIAFEKRAAEENQNGLAAVKLESTIRALPTNNSKKVVHVRLQDKVRETKQPLIGMDQIREVIACSNREVDPR